MTDEVSTSGVFEVREHRLEDIDYVLEDNCGNRFPFNQEEIPAMLDALDTTMEVGPVVIAEENDQPYGATDD